MWGLGRPGSLRKGEMPTYPVICMLRGLDISGSVEWPDCLPLHPPVSRIRDVAGDRWTGLFWVRGDARVVFARRRLPAVRFLGDLLMTL